MPVTIIKEDGNVIANANSLQTVAEFRAAAAFFKDGATILALTDDQVAERLVDGWRYIENNMQWFGRTVSVLAARVISFPRTGLRNLNGIVIPSTTIPVDLIYLQARIAVTIQNYAILEQGNASITALTTTGVTVGLKNKEGDGGRKDGIPTELYTILERYGKPVINEPIMTLVRKTWGG